MQTNIKQSEPFIDYCHITIWFPPTSIDSLRDKETLLNLFKRFLSKCDLIHYTFDADQCPKCVWSLHRPINSHLHFKNSVNLSRSKNWSMGIHFTGGFFKSANWKDNFKQLNETIQKVDDFLYMSLNKVFGFSYPIYELKVSRLDLAINFYNAHIWDAEKQTLAHNKIKDFTVARNGLDGGATGITLSKYSTDKVFFRSYDKRFDENPKAHDKAFMRFNTIDFVRNEWRILPNKMRKLGLRNWTDWANLFKDRSAFNQLILHLRKSRDVTFFRNPSHPYNIIHTNKGWKTFKHKPTVKPVTYEWTPSKQIIGLMEKQRDKMLLKDYHKIMEIVKNDTELIPSTVWRKLNDHWMEKGYFEKSYGWYLRNSGSE